MTATLLLALAVVPTACGGDDGTTATDPAPTTATAEPTPPEPSEAPTPGSLPDFPYQDYAYTLQRRCFCADADQGYRITVGGGVVTGVTWASDGPGHRAGEEVTDEYLRVTIQDIIDQANDPDADHVEVAWPPGQAWPDSVSIDHRTNVADDEVTYQVSDVQFL
jgi:hypothetical protein